MRIQIGLLLLLLAGQAGAAPASRDPVAAHPKGTCSPCGSLAEQAIGAVPELATVKRGRAHVAIRGHVARPKQKAMVLLVEQVIADVERRFLATKGDPHPEITLCLFSDDKRYEAIASVFGPIPSDLGFYMPGPRIALANVGKSIGNLRHELVHPLIGDDFPRVPAWLNEGLGSLYGTARWNKDRFEFLVNYRLRDLQRALKAGRLPSLEQLATSTDDEVRGVDGSVWYAMSRYVLLYLDRLGKLGPFYAELRAARGDVGAQKTILLRYVDEKAFRAWAKQLEY